MTTPAVTITDAISFCADNIAELSYDGVVSIKVRMATWISTMFSASAAVFPRTGVENAGQRRVMDWWGPTIKADATIEGPAAGQCGLVGTSAVIDAVTRALYAVRDSTLAGAITGAQQTATIAAFNACWT